MSTAAAPEPLEVAELRQRAPHGASSGDNAENGAPRAADPATDADEEYSAEDKGKKTFGRTPDGTGKLASDPSGTTKSRHFQDAHVQSQFSSFLPLMTWFPSFWIPGNPRTSQTLWSWLSWACTY